MKLCLGAKSFWLPLAAMLLAGCGPDLPTTAPVSGRITVDGRPVPLGRIVFYPDEGRPAMSPIDPQGGYRLMTFAEGDGAVLGHHRVTVTAVREDPRRSGPRSFEEEMAGVPIDFGAAPPESLVPRHYGQRETTTLTAEVKPGENSIDFSLKTTGE